MELPWIQFYVTALSFKLMGSADAFSARLPFVVIGLLTVLFTYQLGRRLFDVRVACVTVILLISSMPFLLHIRQSRYFALLAFGTVWGIWAYFQYKENSVTAIPQLVGACVFLFHSHYAYFFGFMGALTLWIIAFDRPKQWRGLIAATSAIFLLTFPWAIYAELFNRRGSYGGWSAWDTLANLSYYGTVIHDYVVPIFLLPVLSIVLFKSFRQPSRLIFLTAPILYVAYKLLPDASTVVIGIKSVAGSLALVVVCGWALIVVREFKSRGCPCSFMIVFSIGMVLSLSMIIPNHAFRYLTGLLPCLYLLLAVLLVRLWDHSRAPSVVLGGLALSTNTLSVIPLLIVSLLPVSSIASIIDIVPEQLMIGITGSESSESESKLRSKLASIVRVNNEAAQIHSPILNYAMELANPYQGPLESAIAFLNENADPNDTISSDCDAVSLAFHTGLKIRPMSLKTYRLPAEWIMLRPHQFYATHTGWWIRHFYDEILTDSHEKVSVGAPDLPNLSYHLPDPDLHQFSIDRDSYAGMVIFKKKTDDTVSPSKSAL